MLLLILASVTGATGLGVLIASLVKEPEQLSSYGVAVLMVMGVLGGTFFFGSTDFLGSARFLSMLTINYWGKEGFTTLVFGGGLSDIALNLAVLLLMGVVFFVIGVWRLAAA
ncbi:MAG: ABC transporter permease [Anaerolineae bacterium]|nr:ABC transporter permease [Anaerolineae bacterium]